MNRTTMARLAIVCSVLLVIVGITLAMIVKPAAQAREIEPDWTWRVYPTDRTNTGALLRMKMDAINERVAEIIEQYEQEQAAQAEQAAWEEQQAAYYEPVYYDYTPSYSSGYNNDFQQLGTINDGKHEYSWYSQRVLPGGGLDALNNNGRHVSSDGFICDGDGYIAVASCDYEQGTVIDTPFGEAKVYDYCPTSGTVDVYTDF